MTVTENTAGRPLVAVAATAGGVISGVLSAPLITRLGLGPLRPAVWAGVEATPERAGPAA